MRLDDKQFERFHAMMIDFGHQYNLNVRCLRFKDNPQRCEIKFITDYSRMDGPTYEVNFFEVCSLTEAAAPIMADIMVKFNLTKSGCCVEIKDVIFNPPATIVFWADGTKTVVKDQGEGFDPEKGLAMAISKKALGNQGNYYNQFKKWTEKYEVPLCDELKDHFPSGRAFAKFIFDLTEAYKKDREKGSDI